MHSRFSYDELEIVPYTEHNDTSSHFECASPELNDFLKEDALENQKELISKTYLCYYSNQLVGYITFATDVLKAKEMREKEHIEGMPYAEYPAIKIGRLAVDGKYERKGVGRFLLLIAIGKALKISEEVGCRFITVDSKRESIKFYQKHGFKLVKKHEKQNFPTLYLDIMPVIKEMKPIDMKLDDFSALQSTIV